MTGHGAATGRLAQPNRSVLAGNRTRYPIHVLLTLNLCILGFLVPLRDGFGIGLYLFLNRFEIGYRYGVHIGAVNVPENESQGRNNSGVSYQSDDLGWGHLRM